MVKLLNKVVFNERNKGLKLDMIDHYIILIQKIYSYFNYLLSSWLLLLP